MGDTADMAVLAASKTGMQRSDLQRSPRNLPRGSTRSPRPDSKRGRPVISSSPSRDGGHSGNNRRADVPFEACFLTPRRARSLSARAAARGGLEQIVVHEQDFRRCGGNLNKLRQCQVPPWQEPPKRLSKKEEFEQACRSHMEVRDPWQGLENPERTREVYESDITVNQIWVDGSVVNPNELPEEEAGPPKRAQSVDIDPVSEARRRELLDWVRKVSVPVARLGSAVASSASASERTTDEADKSAQTSRRPSKQNLDGSRRLSQTLKPPRPDSSLGRLPSSADCSTAASTPRAPSPAQAPSTGAGGVSGRSLRSSSSREVKGYRTERPPRAPAPGGSTSAALAGPDAVPRSRGMSRGASDRPESAGRRTPRHPLPPLGKREEECRRSRSRCSVSLQAVADKAQDNAAGIGRRTPSEDSLRPASGTVEAPAQHREPTQVSVDSQLDRIQKELEELSLPVSRRSRGRHC